MCSVYLWIFLQFLAFLTSEILSDSELGHCHSKNAKELKIDQISEWSNRQIARQDKQRQKKNWNSHLIPSELETLQNYFYRMTTEIFQSQCQIFKRISGKWLGGCGFLDGEKLICMDGLYEDVITNNCLVYSFGVGDDWDFEESMAELGCTVHAYDPYVKSPNTTRENLHFYEIGIGSAKAEDDKHLEFTTLEMAMQKNGDHGKKITYLKLDIEQSEVEVLRELIDSEILKNVGQIGVEIHSATYTYAGPEQPKRQRYVFGELLKSFYDLHKKLGFRLVSYNPNGCFHSSNDDPYFINYSYFDLLFYKAK